MNTYRFETTATMKEYNNRRWYIDPGIVRPVELRAENLKSAMETWRGIVEQQNYIEISDNALRTKSAMYVDGKNGEAVQIGYVITGKTDFEKEKRGGWSTQYIDLWVTIKEVSIPEF